jgi:chromosome partitioning protein
MGSAQEDFDWIIFDTQPSIDSVLTMNAFAAADYALIPFELATCSVSGIKQVMDTIADVQNQWLNNDLRTVGFLITLYDNNTDSKHYLELFKESKYAPHLFTTKIRKNVALKKSITAGVPITEYEKNCHGYWDYRDFAHELLQRVEANNVY